MPKNHPSTKAKSTDLKEGQKVTVALGVDELRATVVEDRGHLGVGGRQIVRVELDEPFAEVEENLSFEVPAQELKLL